MASPRQLVAIMFTDIVGYTALMQRNEKQAVALAKRYLSVLSQTAGTYSGRILNDYGDGSLCVFSSAIDALKCAVDMQHQLQTPPVVPLRIGLHIGEIYFEDGKVFGDGVNVASHIQSLGVGGSVLFSREVCDTIKNHPEFKAESLGEFDLQHTEEPEEVFALVGDGLVVPLRGQKEGRGKTTAAGKRAVKARRKKWLVGAAIGLVVLVASVMVLRNLSSTVGRLTGKPKPPNSIAVLYFSNMSGDPAQEYFTDGMTEEIITRLSMIEGLRVKSRTSVLQYKGKGKTARQIARELGVRNILEGSVRKQGNQLRVTAQLIDAARDEHIWAENYDRELQDVFAVQSDIAQHIAQKFQITLSEKTRKKLEAPLTVNMEAYDYFLKARSLSTRGLSLGGDKTNKLTAMNLLRQALQLDPSFAEAYALLSSDYVMMSRDAPDPQRWTDTALQLARAAVHYAPDKVDGYQALAIIYENTGDIDEALRWAQKCDEVQPYSLVTYTAQLYARKKQYGKAMEWTEKAVRHDPTEADNYVSKSYLFYELGMLDSMKKYIDIALKVQPDRTDVVWTIIDFYLTTRNAKEFERVVRARSGDDEKVFNYEMGIFYLFNRQWKKADSLYQLSTHPEDMDAALAKLHLGEAETGVRLFEKALEIRLQAAGFWDHWRFYDVARIYAALQDPRYAYYLQKAIDNGWHEYTFFQQDPFFDYVRPEPEFQKIAQTLNQRNERFKADLLRSM